MCAVKASVKQSAGAVEVYSNGCKNIVDFVTVWFFPFDVTNKLLWSTSGFENIPDVEDCVIYGVQNYYVWRSCGTDRLSGSIRPIQNFTSVSVITFPSIPVLL